MHSPVQAAQFNFNSDHEALQRNAARIGELEKKVDILENEAESVYKFNEIQRKHKTSAQAAESGLSKQVSQLKASVKSLQDELATNKKETQDLKTLNEALETKIAELESFNGTLQMELDEVRQQMRENDKDLRKQIKDANTKAEEAGRIAIQATAALALVNSQAQQRLPAPQPNNEDVLDLRAGQVAFEFIKMATEYVLGKESAKENKLHLVNLDDVAILAKFIEDEKAVERWNKLSSVIDVQSSSFAVKSLKRDCLSVVHPPAAATMSATEVRDLLRGRIPDRVADAFVKDFERLRGL